MDATQNSKLLLHEQEKHTSPYHAYPNSITLSNLNPKKNHVTNLNPMKLIKEPKSARPDSDDDSFVQISTELASSWYSQHYVEEYSESDSCSGVGVDEYSDDEGEEEVSLEYELLMHDGKTKRKIEELAAMVGVDTTEPALVLSEVVRVLKHLNRRNHIHY